MSDTPEAASSTPEIQPAGASTSTGGFEGQHSGGPPEPPRADEPDEEPPEPGVGEAVGGVRAAVMRMIHAHLALLRAELSITGKELGVIVGLALGALAVLALVATLFLVGGFLFYGEWLYGSMGWGIIHGTLLGGVIIGYVAVNLAGGQTWAYWQGALAGFVAAAAIAALLLSNVGNRIFEAGRGYVEEGMSEGGIVFTSEAVAAVIGFIVGGILVGAAGALIAWLVERASGRSFGITPQLAGIGFIIGAIAGALVASTRLDVPEFTVGTEWITTLLGFAAGAVVVGLLTGIALWRVGLREGLRPAITVGVVIGGIAGGILSSTRYEAPDGVMGLAIMIGLITWIATGVMLAQRRGFDPEARWANLIPSESIAAFEKTKDFVMDQWERQKGRVLGR